MRPLYSDIEYEISKADLSSLMKKKEDLRRYLEFKKKAQKDIHLFYITTNGVNSNKYFHQLQPTVLKLEDLFQNDSA